MSAGVRVGGQLSRVLRRSVVAAGAAALTVTIGAPAGAQMPGMPEMKHMMSWENTLFVLFDQLEMAPGADGRPVSVGALAWYGGARRRVWVRAEGEQATTAGQGEGSVEVLYGKLVDPFWDAVVGLRADKAWGDEGPGRVLLGAGLIGLAPYRFEFEPTVFVSQRGELSARLEASYQVLITQRLVAEPEIELNAALQAAPRFGVGRGLNDYEMGLRVRYEFRREFAPYVGWSQSRRLGATADLAREGGEDVSENRFVAGFRIWR